MLLNEQQIDVFRELINIGVGKSAALLNEMIESPIKLNIPKIWVTTLDDLNEKMKTRPDSKISSIKLSFEGAFSGIAEILFPQESASNLVALLTGEDKDSPEMDVLRAGTLNEVANVLLNGVMGSIGNLLEDRFEYSLPHYNEESADKLFGGISDESRVVLYGETHFEVLSLNIEGDIIMLLELTAFESLKKCLDSLLEG